ncbi:MAG: cell division/cell wall cluster transcriptional repressor MraZ [Chloroflexi bacterium]|nr:cell division/cell wall cluster transcriptional repressor MraZ [Chloroflexota bacterium]
MSHFLGRYDYAMDERGRSPVPPRFRDEFLRGGVLSQGPDLCLRLFTAESFEEQSRLYTREPATERSGRQTRRAFFGRSFNVELDRQGRILIPAPLRAYAALETNVVVIGAGEWLELWSPDRFEAEMAVAGAE